MTIKIGSNPAVKRDAPPKSAAPRPLPLRWANDNMIMRIKIKTKFLAALILLSITAMVSANDLDTANTLPRLSPRDLPSLPEQVASALIKMGCTIPQSFFLEKHKTNVISGNFAMKGQKDFAVLCSKNGASHIEIIWGGKTRCDSKLKTIEDNIFFQEEDSGKKEFSRILGVTPSRAIVNLSPADDGSKIYAPYHEAIQDSFGEKGSSIYYCEKGKWRELEGAD